MVPFAIIPNKICPKFFDMLCFPRIFFEVNITAQSETVIVSVFFPMQKMSNTQKRTNHFRDKSFAQLTSKLLHKLQFMQEEFHRSISE